MKHSMRDPQAWKAGGPVRLTQRTGLESLAYMFDAPAPTFITEFEGTPYAVMYEIDTDGTIIDVADVGV